MSARSRRQVSRSTRPPAPMWRPWRARGRDRSCRVAAELEERLQVPSSQPGPLPPHPDPERAVGPGGSAGRAGSGDTPRPARPAGGPRPTIRSDFSLIWVPCGSRSPPRRETLSSTPGGDSYPRSSRFSVEMTEVLTWPCGWPTAPSGRRSGVSARRTQGEPTNRSRAMANRATTSGCPASGGVASVTRRCWTRRRVGVFSVAFGWRIGTR